MVAELRAIGWGRLRNDASVITQAGTFKLVVRLCDLYNMHASSKTKPAF